MSTYALVAAATETAEHTNDLPMPAWMFGLLALGAFAVLLGVTWSFRSVGVHHGETH